MQTAFEIKAIRQILAGDNIDKIRAIIQDYELLPYELRALKKRFPALDIAKEIKAFKAFRKRQDKVWNNL